MSRIVAAHATPGPSGTASEHVVELEPGLRFRVRDVRPSDEPALVQLLEHMTQEEVRLRFFVSMRRFGHPLVGPMTSLDGRAGIGLVALREGDGALAAHAMLVALPDGSAEFAVLVHRQHAHHGLGQHLIECLVSRARACGLKQVYGIVLMENHNMLQLAREMGFAQRPGDAPGTLRVALDLEPRPAT